ncbi:MAG: MFS transporter [marine bacterium B5-7]|nr:MAG: MFS transporter [marine bacterium B5-7]
MTLLNNNNRHWWVLIATGFMILLVNLDIAIVNVAMAPIAKVFHASLSQVQWVGNSYVLAAAMCFVVGGRLADMKGKRRIYIMGAFVFALGSAFAAAAPTIWALVAGRAIQGAGFAFALSLALVLTTEAFPVNRRGFAVGVTVTITGIAQSVGPTLGGLILHYASWHWIFIMNIPLAILSIVLTLMACHDDARNTEETLDGVGFLLLSLGVVPLVLVLNELVNWGWSSDKTLIGFAVSALSLLAFFWHERRVKHPLVDVKLFRYTSFTASIGVRAMFMYSWMLVLLFLPLYYQNILGFTPLKTGLTLLLLTVVAGAASPLTGHALDKVGFKKVSRVALWCSVVATGMFACMTYIQATWYVSIAMIFYGLSLGMLLTSTINGVLSSVPETVSGACMGIFFTAAFLVSAISIAVGGSLMALVSRWHLPVALRTQTIERMAQGVAPSQHATLQIAHQAKTAFLTGFSVNMWICFGLLLIGLWLSRFMRTHVLQD